LAKEGCVLEERCYCLLEYPTTRRPAHKRLWITRESKMMWVIAAVEVNLTILQFALLSTKQFVLFISHISNFDPCFFSYVRNAFKL